MTDEPGDDIERILTAATPRGAPPQLRAIVISAVAAELSAAPGNKRPWQSWVNRAVAATLLFSIATFLTSIWWEARRMAAWDARPVVRSDVTDLVAAASAVSGDKAGREIERYLLAHLQPDSRQVCGTMQQEVREIKHWAGHEPLANRSQSDENTQDHI